MLTKKDDVIIRYRFNFLYNLNFSSTFHHRVELQISAGRNSINFCLIHSTFLGR